MLTRAMVPTERNFLCEGCGYILAGLAESGNCPECGRAIAHSRGDRRKPSAFETMPSLASFVRTSLGALLRPRRFFDSLSTPATDKRALWLARCHRTMAAAVLAVAGCGYLMIDRGTRDALRAFYRQIVGSNWPDEPVVYGWMLAPATVIVYALIILLTHVYARAATSIAAQRGARLQPSVVTRALQFHSVHLVPTALIVAVTVGGWLSLQLVPLAMIFYLIITWVTVCVARVPLQRAPDTKATERIFRAVRVVIIGVFLAVVAGWYFALLDSPYFDEVAMWRQRWRGYFVLTVAGLCAAELVITGCMATRAVMYANDQMEKGSGL